ncbi:MAG TPA: adenylyl-sulfate kinase, partial [Myxococcales bacterium]|nr:adenylyl-sulfate kinase [Myxococcales bacterium]
SGICERQGKQFEYAFLLDALAEEQEQGITIDAARCFFKTDKRDYIIIDAPGHIEFLKNMVTGAARAEAAVLLIDADEGVRENSRRHGYLLSMLGVSQVVVAVNKMDLADYSQAVFERIEAEYSAFLAEIGVTPRCFVPISAREGDFVAAPLDNMPWFSGLTILDAVDAFEKQAPRENQALRMPVQDVYRFNTHGDQRRIVAGRIESGSVKVGDKVVFMPSAKTSVIASIEVFSAPSSVEVHAGESVGVTLAEQVYVRRGDIMSHVEVLPQISTLIRANIFWLGKESMVFGKRYKLKLGTASVECEIAEIMSVLDASNLESSTEKEQVERYDVAEVLLRTRNPLAFDRTQDVEHTGRFVIVDDYDIWGGGIIRDVVEDEQSELRIAARQREFQWLKGLVTMADREFRWGHKAGLVLFSGDAGTGKAMVARYLERYLFDNGVATYLLDGTNVLLGLGHDANQAEREETREELIHRYGEIAHLFVDSGNIVISTTNTIGLADHQKLATLVAPAELLSIHICPHHEQAPLNADLVFSSVEDYDQVVDRIVRLLIEREFIQSAGQVAD